MVKVTEVEKGKDLSRTERLKERHFSLISNPELSIERAKYVTESYKETEGEPEIIRRAKAIKNVLAKISVNIWPDELIVGSYNGKELGGAFYPDANSRLSIEIEQDLIDDREQDPFSLSPADLREAKEDIIPYWRGRTLEDHARERWSEEVNDRVNMIGTGIIFTEVQGIGHIVLNYQKVLKVGLNGIIKEIDGYLSLKEDHKGRDFYDAAKISCRAVIDFAERYAEKAQDLMREEKDEGRRKELEEIARICRKVPAKPAETFYEALQSIYFVNIIARIEDYEASVSIGRLDQILYPYYKGDMEKSRLSREEAQTLLECLYLKLSSITLLLDDIAELAFGGYTTWTNAVVGGIDENGNDATNELSFLALDAREHICLHQPNFGVRLHGGTDPRFFDRVSRSMATGKGKIQVFNDEIIIPLFEEQGITHEDATNYGIIGCVELGSVPGKSFNSADAALFDLPYCLSLALNRGKNDVLSPFRGGGQMGLVTKDPNEFKSIDDVIDAYREQLNYLVALFAEGLEGFAESYAEYHPLPFISSITEDCLKEGKDVTWGGAKYNFTSIQGVGLANVADSLAAIDKLVFKEKKITMDDLVDAIEKNFEGYEPLRQMLINRAPKYGNDDDEVDKYAKRVVEIFSDAWKGHSPDYRGGKYIIGLYAATTNLTFGMGDPAFPSGRMYGEPLSVGITPTQGMNTSGPTAALKSAAKIDYKLVGNGGALNLKFNPSSFKGEEGVKRFSSLLKTYFEIGGIHLQCNMVDRKTLLAAKERPEEYKDLIVRPAGYSVYFVQLAPMAQDDIISRTEYQEGEI